MNCPASASVTEGKGGSENGLDEDTSPHEFPVPRMPGLAVEISRYSRIENFYKCQGRATCPLLPTHFQSTNGPRHFRWFQAVHASIGCLRRCLEGTSDIVKSDYMLQGGEYDFV